MSDSGNSAGFNDLGGGVAWMGTKPPMGVADAQNALWSMTGVPDLQAGGNALARGEILPGLGQSAWGAAQLGSLAFPLARGAGRLVEGLVPGLLGNVSGSAKVGGVLGWHGTPHKFEPVEGNPFGEFKDAAIGTGEGAQAYGWGHYIAGNPKVATSYQSAGLEDYQVLLNGKPLVAEEPHIALAHDALRNAGTVPHPSIAGTHTPYFDMAREELENLVESSNYNTTAGQALKWLNENEKNLTTSIPKGHLLEVHILPDEHEFLDWDKPLAEQSPGVREALEKRFGDLSIFENTSAGHGQTFYRALVGDYGGDRAASALLHEAGIPGIKYLDAGSRAAGEGTSNYVVFHPSNLRIVGRNGERLEPVDHDPFAAEVPKAP